MRRMFGGKLFQRAANFSRSRPAYRRPARADVSAGLPWDVGLTPFTGTHPAVMREWLVTRAGRFNDQFLPRPWNRRRLALAASLGIERLTGWRPFEHRNYVEV